MILPLIFTEEHGLTVFESRVLRKIFGSEKVEVTGELYDLYCSPNIRVKKTKE
jgi:hypothetical protein